MNLARYVGIPYGFEDDLAKSVDCWQLVRHFVKNELGRDYPQFMYDTSEDRNLKAALIYIANETGLGKRWTKIAKPAVGDVMILRIKGHPIHCGVYVGEDSMLHTLKGRSSCIETMKWWGQQLDGIYRFNPAD